MEDDFEASISSHNSARKVIQIVAGEAHTLALTGDGRVFAWGRGTFGRLGTRKESDELVPVQVEFGFAPNSEGKKVKLVGIAAGAYHSLALADDGSVWCWGYNIYGQLGIDGDNSLVPRLLDDFLELGSPGPLTGESETKSKKPLKVSYVEAGGMMSLAIDDIGGLWMWGNIPVQSSTGTEQFSLVSCPTPVPVWDLHGRTVVKVACGNEHVVALVSAGETDNGGDLICYAWGGNSNGQLGLGDKESRLHPQIIENFKVESPWKVYDVACGAFHTALLTHRKRPSDTLESMCWTFGLGANGQLGHGTTQNALVPEYVKELPNSVFLISVDCGLFHTSVVSSAGDVWSWGMEKGLGLCPDASFTGTDAGDAISPLRISLNDPRMPKFKEPVQIACGAAHTVLVADDGYKLWGWGRGSIGILGNGKMVDCLAPTMVLWPPLAEDFTDDSLRTTDSKGNIKDKNTDLGTEADQRLSAALEEIRLLKSKLYTIEQYAAILHGSIFGKPFEEQDIPISLHNSGMYDISREWENMLESMDRGKLVRMEMFYQNMLAGVKDKIMKKTIHEIVKELLHTST
ncbi:unnamed protein product [Rhodiola kirilowii]